MRLAQFDRLSAIGALGSGLAHEISQPLTAARTYLARSRNLVCDGDQQLPDLLASSEEEIARAGNVLSHLRDFVRHGQPSCREYDLRTLVNEVISLVEPRLCSERVHADVALDGSAEGRDLRVWIDPVFIQQILFNLLGNAIDAMAGLDDRQRRVRVSADREDGFIRLRVSDNGDGINPESAQQLFDPFHTSKADGIGLGLAVSRSLAEAHGGTLELDEKDGPGATFVLSLPERSTA